MACKPPVLCKLERGKLIDVQKHFVDTFNWLVDFAANFKGLVGIEISGVDRGLPEISLRLESGDNIEIKEENGTLKISAKSLKLISGRGIFVDTDDKNNESTLSANIEAGDNISIDELEGGLLRINSTASSEGKTYVKGDDTNIVFTPIGEESIAVDVYYS